MQTLKPRLSTLSTHKLRHKKANWGKGRGGRPWRRLRDTVLARDLYTCQACGRVGGELEIDHIINTAQGGTDDIANLQTLCKPCHQQKTQTESMVGGIKQF